MRHFLLTLGLLLPFLCLAQEEIEYKTYSYTEFFQMIEDEEDSVFRLSNALIRANQATDSLHYVPVSDVFFGLDAEDFKFESPERDTIVIDKSIKLNNVQFTTYDVSTERTANSYIQTGFYKIKFLQPVEINNTFSILFEESTFEKGLTISADKISQILSAAQVEKVGGKSFITFDNENFIIESCAIEESFDVRLSLDDASPYFFVLKRSTFPAFDLSTFIFLRNYEFYISSNRFEDLRLTTRSSSGSLRNSQVGGISVLAFAEKGNISILDNHFEDFVSYYRDFDPKVLVNTNWQQWFGKYTSSTFRKFLPNDVDMNNLEGSIEEKFFRRKSFLQYQDSLRFSNYEAYKLLTRELAAFYSDYKQNHDKENANLVYREIKNLETQRLAYLYELNPNFKTFFKWRINQFLKAFSAYGTEPERAIIFSMYVILAFALVYLFFPNYWDSHGKNRIMDRYRFFLKYVNRDSGMHEVYLDEKKPELLASEDFKLYLQEQGKTAPKFFMATALPLYRWSVAGTNTFSWMLSKVDVLKGKWSDTEDSKKGGKSVLLVAAFLIALLYDLFIKVLNALMLSINTFTTLGFGEIPIKGLPRYLAIIQGFIGWFMLTIFSVSLISQLLN